METGLLPRDMDQMTDAANRARRRIHAVYEEVYARELVDFPFTHPEKRAGENVRRDIAAHPDQTLAAQAEGRIVGFCRTRRGLWTGYNIRHESAAYCMKP